jgi:hypothetical protein
MSTANEETRTHFAVDPTLVAHAAGLARALPEADAPSPPAAFDPAAKRSMSRKLEPRHVQVDLAPKVASELRRNSAAYAQQFGDAVPPADDVADASSSPMDGARRYETPSGGSSTRATKSSSPGSTRSL